MNQNPKMNRRSFFASFAKLAGVAAVAPTVLSSFISSEANAQKKRGEKPGAGGGTEMPLIDPNDSVAKAVKYIEDAKKSPESKGNDCANCGFYAKKGTHNGKETGTCTIFAGKLVYAEAWCGSWNKKA